MSLGEQPRADLLAEPTARTYPLAQLVGMVREGVVRVPHFQRGLRWKKADAVALIDSVLRGFPIGSLLLWQRRAPAETVRLGEVTVEAPERTDARYVVDGQQRVTTFLNVFDPKHGLDGEFALVYDLRQQPPRVRARTRNDSGDHAIPLPVLFELPRLLRWVGEHPNYVDRIDEINTATQRLREFHVPVYEVRSEDDGVLREIYDRMNNAGKRLTRAEAFKGLFAPGESDSTATTFETIQDDIRVRLNWGQIDHDTILHAFLARRAANPYRDIHLEFQDDRKASVDFPDEDQEQAHHRLLDALETAIEFLRDNAGIPHFTFLAYRPQLVVMARFFGLFPQPVPRNLDLLRRWYWRMALSGPGMMAGNTTGAVRTLTACIRRDEEGDSVQRLLKALPQVPGKRVDAHDFRANRASGRIMVCALWHRRPLSPDTGSRLDMMISLLRLERNPPRSPRPRRSFPGLICLRMSATRWETVSSCRGSH
ncbi:MAG: DUF262 domain-containing protein [Propionibacterium sp.]|nr:DUF262 domain-containing protein [Propionibacterium sp.]